ncbi:MAG: hypothetical protein QF410_11270 [Planctomycetota bacterium]|jgi:hypothetical protein|nr:hypothetical protein [Planctomycetota bacterium]
MSPRLIEERRCPHCSAELAEEIPRVCPECGGSLQRRYLGIGCLSTKPLVLLLACALAVAADACRGEADGARTAAAVPSEVD